MRGILQPQHLPVAVVVTDHADKTHHRARSLMADQFLVFGQNDRLFSEGRAHYFRHHSSIPAPPASSSSAHAISATPRSARVIFASNLVLRVVELVGVHPETIAHSPGRAGQVDDQGTAGHTA